MKTYPITETQLGMFLDWNVNRASVQYSLPYLFRIPASVDIEKFIAAIQTYFDAYPVFRTRFVEADGEVRQFVDPTIVFPCERRTMSAPEAEQALKAYPRPFDLFTDPLVRFDLIETPENYLFVVETSHLIMDGSTFTMMQRAVSKIYAGEGDALPKEEMAYAAHAESEAASFETEEYRAAAADAKARFGGRAMTVPEEQGEGGVRDEKHKGFILTSAEMKRDEVDAFCRANAVHPNLFFMGVFARTLALYANEREVVFYTVNHGRKDPALRMTQGLMVRTLPVLGEVKGELGVVDYFKSFKLHRAGVYPFTHFCRDLGLTPGWGIVFQEGTFDPVFLLDGRVVEGKLLASGGAGELPTVQVFGERDCYRFEVTALPGRYSEEFLQGFIERCTVIAKNSASAAGKRLAEVSVLTPDEEARVIKLAKGEELEYDTAKTFVDLFTEQVAARAEAMAIVDSEGAISYGELDARSSALAARLQSLGVKAGGFVGLMLPRSRAFPIAMIAVQKCGAGYVPMDAEYPADRLAYMLENSESPVLITTRELFEKKKLDYLGKVLFFEDSTSPLPSTSSSPSTSSLNLATPDTPAYMIYTSGSTGKPKGVVLPNRALAAMIAWFVRDCGLTPGKKNLSITSFSFDASVPDLFPPLAAGGELHILTEDQRKDLEGVHDYAVKVGATGLTTSTQLGLALVNTYPDLPLEYMMLGGEKMVPFAKTPVRMLNGYGPTEFAVCSSYHEVDQSKTYEIPIGRAVPNTYSFVVDKLGALVPKGMIGELALMGPQIAEGYWRLPEKTASVFVPAPQLSKPSKPSLMYRTGDLARYNAEGTLDYMGRIDFQVKLRGFRIEIGEIEHRASTFPGIGAVAAEVREVAGAKHLVLYYEGGSRKEEGGSRKDEGGSRKDEGGSRKDEGGSRKDEGGRRKEEELREHLAKTLTSYMVPDFFVAMEKLPLTPNGKIDRKQLPTPQAEDEPIVAPETETENKIFSVVAAVLKTQAFGVTHDFNRLGLTSLGAMSLMAKLKKECGFAVSMKMLVANPTVRQLAAMLTSQTAQTSRTSRCRPRRQFYPMTENQRGIYADWLRNPDATQYNIPAAFKFTKVAADALKTAAEQVFNVHPAFKTRFVERNGEIVQERRDDFPIEVNIEKVDFEPDAAYFTQLVKPFKPDAEVLSRGTVYASKTASYLFLDIHHTVFDGFSVGIFLSELMKALKGESLVPETYTSFDAALDERDYLESESVEEDDKWFERYLDGLESTSFPTSASRTEGRPGEAGRVVRQLKGEAILNRTKELGVTVSDFFLVVFTELLRRLGREEKTLINFVTAGRSAVETQETVGMFVKTLPIRGIADATTMTEATRRIHASVTELIDRERASYVRLSEKFGVRPEILFAFEGGIFDLPEGVEILEPETGLVKAPLTAIVTPKADGFELKLEYDKSKYAFSEMQELVTMFATLSENATTLDTLKEIPLLSDGEAQRVLELSRGTEVSYDATKTVVNLIHANAIARPFATAVVDCEGSITYGELDERSSLLAALLQSYGVKVGGFVGLMLPRRLSFVVSFLAVQKCGAGYVPMDAEYPVDRLAYMLENSESPVLITTRELFAGKNLDFSGKVIFFEDELSALTSLAKTSPVDSQPFNLSTPDTPAYMIYTSGSTGKPKGVVIPHRGLRHLIAWTVGLFKIHPGEKVVTHPSFSFDASVFDIFPTLAAGGELHLYSEAIRKDLPSMRDYILTHGITGGTMSTQIGMMLIDTYPDLPLRYLCFGGEKLLPIAKTKVTLINGYGPTEFTVVSSYQIVDQSKEGDIPIGRPAPGTYSIIVDRYGQLLPQGFPGELALMGPQLADGYWRLPEKTAAVFMPPPKLSQPSKLPKPSLMYRTGDLARYNAEGTIDYLGRLDFQVKLRGFRIEIGEIEHRASTFPGVGMVAAEVREVAGAKHLVLYYASESALDETALKAHLAQSLTEYMVPDYFVRMEPMPLTPNGKINRKKLPTPMSEDPAKNDYVEPANATEQKIAEAYGEILKLEKFGATMDFFAAGGTSLIGIKAIVALQKRGLDVQYGDIFKYKTPRALADFLTGASAAAITGNSNSMTAEQFNYGAYDYTAIDKLLMATPTDLFKDFHRHSLGDVLLTGATGYLGIHILRYLLESTDSTVYALVRSKKGVGPEKRIDSQFVYYFGKRIPRAFKDRLVFIEGDITDANLLTTATPAVTTVINCAALVKHYVADDLMDRINVGGVKNLIAFCERTGARLVHASTYSVGGLIRSDSGVVLDERHLYVGQESDNDYVRTKFLAERAILEAVAAGGLKAKIMRLGNLMGRESDGEFQMNVAANAFVNSLKSYKAVGSYPLENLAGKIEMSPIDRVAEAVVLLSTTPEGMIVFHPYNCYPLDMGAVVGAMNRRGFVVDWVSREEFAGQVEALKSDPTRAGELQGILHYAGHLLKNQRVTPALNDWTTTVLYRLGFRWKPADDGYLANFFEMLDTLAVFD